jgi:hypothetical protein
VKTTRNGKGLGPRLLLGLLALGALAMAAYRQIVRPWRRDWGARDDED